MITLDQLDQLVLHILMHAARGKDRNGRPKPLSAYGVCALLPRDVADYYIGRGNVGGKNGKTVPGQPTFTQVVQHSLKRLMRGGFARHSYEDTTAISFNIHGHVVEPSYEVMALYQYVPQVPTTGVSTPP
jgi:hypothetical protein